MFSTLSNALAAHRVGANLRLTLALGPEQGAREWLNRA